MVSRTAPSCRPGSTACCSREILARGDWLLTHGHDLALDPVCALLYREAQAAQLLTQQRIAGVR